MFLFTFSGQLGVSSDSEGDGNPKLWCALSDGKVVVFDAASWSMQQNQVQVGTSRVVRLWMWNGDGTTILKE